jgi:hypothetical protein
MVDGLQSLQRAKANKSVTNFSAQGLGSTGEAKSLKRRKWEVTVRHFADCSWQVTIAVTKGR